jgi:hypothetical protein
MKKKIKEKWRNLEKGRRIQTGIYRMDRIKKS